jgi:uncharacterized membrane protein
MSVDLVHPAVEKVTLVLEGIDAVITVKDANGHIKLNQLINTTAVGAVSGTFWGALIGLIFLMPLAGAAIGAASCLRANVAALCLFSL